MFCLARGNRPKFPRLIASFFIAAVTGLTAGAIHVWTGPDHLAAIAPLAENLATKEFWKLRPTSRVSSGQSVTAGNQQRVVVTTTAAQDLTVVYQPEAQVVTWMPRARSQATWLNPRTGERHPVGSADAAIANQSFNPPSPGDWVLILQTTPPTKAKKPDEKIDKQR